jgi:hypothetical protein
MVRPEINSLRIFWIIEFVIQLQFGVLIVGGCADGMKIGAQFIVPNNIT